MKNSTGSHKYTTLAKDRTKQATYHDRDSLPFEAVYPLIEFGDEFIEKNTDHKKLEKYLSSNFWYQKANSVRRQVMIERIMAVNSNIDIILDFIEQKYGHFDKECLHISIAGSYLYSDNPGDIDLDVVLDGSFFDYSYFSNGIELLDITNGISKVSLTVMGSDNISGLKKIPSDIENEGFLHQDTIVRETLVAPMRNVTVYGKPFLTPNSLDSKNIITRIARQLYFASLTLKGQIPYYKDEPLRTKKVLSRIDEAHDILEWLYMNISTTAK